MVQARSKKKTRRAKVTPKAKKKLSRADIHKLTLRIQRTMRKYFPGDRSLSEEFIQERRREAARETAEDD